MKKPSKFWFNFLALLGPCPMLKNLSKKILSLDFGDNAIHLRDPRKEFFFDIFFSIGQGSDNAGKLNWVACFVFFIHIHFKTMWKVFHYFIYAGNIDLDISQQPWLEIFKFWLWPSHNIFNYYFYFLQLYQTRMKMITM